MTKPRKTMKTVEVGIYQTASGSFMATIGGKSLGTYKTFGEAITVRRSAEQQRWPNGPPTPHRFKPGHKINAGRSMGKQNKLTRDLKEGIIDAAVASGYDGKGKDGLAGYLKMLADKYPKQYTSLLGRMLPLQISGNLNTFIGAVNISSGAGRPFPHQGTGRRDVSATGRAICHRPRRPLARSKCDRTAPTKGKHRCRNRMITA